MRTMSYVLVAEPRKGFQLEYDDIRRHESTLVIRDNFTISIIRH